MDTEAQPTIPPTSVVVPAAGSGIRMGCEVRKPWIQLGGEPLVVRTCRRLSCVPGVAEIILAVHVDDLEAVQGKRAGELAACGVTLSVEGGKTRAESVWNAVQVMSAGSELIAIHDAARPFVSQAVCTTLLQTAARYGAAVPIVPMSDTVKRVEGEAVVETPSRLGLVRVQTPQVFRSDLFIDACEYALRTGGFPESLTDDAMLVENFGHEVAVVLSEETNIKVTTPRDLRIAEALLAAGAVPE